MVNNIHALRAFAALIVTVHHVQGMINHDLGGQFRGGFGAAGVDIFFVISGFVMVYSNSTRKATPLAFLWDRAARVYPLWWVALALLLLVFGAGFRPVGLHSFTWPDVTASLLLVAHVRSVGTLEPILMIGWTLLYEVYFYLLFSCFLSFSKLSQGIAGLGVFLVMGIAAGSSLSGDESNRILRFYTSPIMLEFLAGCLLGLAYADAHKRQRHELSGGRKPISSRQKEVLKIWGWVLFGLGATMILGYDAYNGAEVDASADRPYGRLVVFGVPAVMIVAGALILEYIGAILKPAAIVLLGSASYALYLFHMIIMQAIVKAIGVLHGAPMALTGQLCVAIFAVFCATAFAVAMHLRVEVPIARSLKRTRAFVAGRLSTLNM